MKLPKKSILPGPPSPGRPTLKDTLSRKMPLTNDQKALLDQMTPEKDESGTQAAVPTGEE